MWRSVWEVIPHKLKTAWERQNIRGVVLLSLLLQIILILGAPFRKRTGKKWVILLIWLSYLFADWAASFAVGLISNSQSSKPGENSDLLAFWAPFLLLHLGGPDTITAFALEDNELWLRHFLSLVFQVVATVYVFLQTLGDKSNNLWLATLLMFFAGIIKYAERTRSLYLASLGRFRESMLKEPDPGPNYAKLMEEYSSKKDAGLPTKIDLTAEPDKESKDALLDAVKKGDLDDFEVVENAYHFFKIFKGLIVDLIFSFRERNESRKFFEVRTAEDALRVIEVELNFIYEALYTKVVVVHDVKGYFFRALSSTSIWVALALFISLDKSRLRKFDIGITYTLLIGALSLELLALFMLIFSDWTIASLKKTKNFPIIGTIFKIYLKMTSSRWAECKEGSTMFSKLATPIILRRWSESVSGFNLITYCLKERSKKFHEVKVEAGFVITRWIGYLKIIWEKCWKKVVDYFGAKEFLDELKYVASKPFKRNLWQFIFLELLQKSKDADDAETTKRICSARGAYVLEEYGKVENLEIDKKLIADYVENVNFDESLLLWHIATELCYEKEKEVYGGDHPAKQGGVIDSVSRWIGGLWHNGSKTDGSVKTEGNANDSARIAITADDSTTNDHREFSKLLSDYMLYLLVMQPTMMSAVAGIGQIRFRDTCAEAEKFFSRRGLRPTQEHLACKNLLDVNTDVKPIHVKGDRSKSVLFDACMLSKELEKLEKKEKWLIMSKVWVEMLSYASSHCRPFTHAQQVSKGGQLITLVWLLMAHFGLGEQFQINEGHARAKLLVGK